MSVEESDRALTCPSAQPEMEEARILGVIDYSSKAKQVLYLKGRERLDPNTLGNVPKALMGQVLRLSAKCERSRCAQFSDGKCGLGERIAHTLADVVNSLPSCSIRNTCRWHAEQGAKICLKCPQIVTSVSEDDVALSEIASPSTLHSIGRTSTSHASHEALGDPAGFSK
jgi:hypothetical protein